MNAHQQISRVYPVVTPESCLEALNTGNVFVAWHKELVKDWPRAWLGDNCVRKVQPIGGALYQKARTIFQSHLCKLVDEWIESGRTNDGTETPQQRRPNVLNSRALGAAHDYVRRYPPEVVVSHKDWTVDVIFTPIPFITDPGPSTILDLAEREAISFFVVLLTTDWRNTIVKCRREKCGRYYRIKNPRRLYKRGTYCRSCNSANSAALITAQKRITHHEGLLQLAAKALRESRESWGPQGERKLKASIQLYVNRKVADKITVKWVTRNFPAIQQLARKPKKGSQ